MNKEQSTALNIGSLAIQCFFMWACVLGLIIASVWSFFQTYDFVHAGQNNVIVAYALALAIQYFQNVAIFYFLRDKSSTQINRKLTIQWRWVWLFGFVVSAIVDAGTNIGEWRTANPEMAATLNVWSFTWQLICVLVIFVEEVLGKTFGAALDRTAALGREIGFGSEQKKVSPFPPNMGGGDKRPVGRPPKNNPLDAFRPNNKKNVSPVPFKPQQNQPPKKSGSGETPEWLKDLINKE